MDVQKIEELVRILEASPTEELCVQKGDYKVCIRKGKKPPVAQAKKPVAGDSPAPSTQAPAAERYITAPMVGIFHVVDGIAQVGATVILGHVVGAIESMKLTNDIRSKVSGVVVEVLVEDGMPVEYGQPLFKVEPE
jgi:acetyl-CoA carboxylase biotin carboxyl carrier protein